MKEEGEGRILCLVSLFQFCRYFTLIRRLADLQSLVLEYPPNPNQVVNQGTGHEDMSDRPEDEKETSLLAGDAFLNQQSTTAREDPLSIERPPFIVELNQIATECAICMDKPEDCVLMCCSHGLCRSCEKRWVRKRLRCPFCRQSFSSVKQAVTTQWELGVSAVPVEQIQKDIQCLEQKIYQFWLSARAGEQDDAVLASILTDNYTQRPKTIQSIPAGEADGFVVLQELAGIVV